MIRIMAGAGLVGGSSGKPEVIHKRASGRSMDDLLEADFWPASFRARPQVSAGVLQVPVSPSVEGGLDSSCRESARREARKRLARNPK